MKGEMGRGGPEPAVNLHQDGVNSPSLSSYCPLLLSEPTPYRLLSRSYGLYYDRQGVNSESLRALLDKLDWVIGITKKASPEEWLCFVYLLPASPFLDYHMGTLVAPSSLHSRQH